MKTHILLITCLTLINFSYAFYNEFVRNRFGLKEYKLDLSSLDINKQCGNINKCIWKCCPEGQVMGRFKTCNTSDADISNVTVYNERHERINKSLTSSFDLVPNMLKDEIFAENALWWFNTSYLIEDGKLHLKFPNVYNRWKIIETDHFCVEMNAYKNLPVFMVEYELDHIRNPSVIKKWSLILSTTCLVLTFAVYAMVRELRDLSGIILMIHLGCLIVAFITHSILESYNTMMFWMSQIMMITFFHYFFKVSSITWTNVMFYRLLVSSSRRKEGTVSWKMQLIKYCAFSFGLSLFMTILMATIELSDMTDTPSFVTPQIQNRGNFTFHALESLYYLYYPLLIMLVFNWIVCFVKVIEFCKTKKQFAAVAGHNDGQDDTFNRPMQFVKLLTLLTAYVCVESLTVIFLEGTHDTSAIYSLCIGPIIMIIFLWNKNVLKLLSERLKTFKRRASDASHIVSFLHKAEPTDSRRIDGDKVLE